MTAMLTGFRARLILSPEKGQQRETRFYFNFMIPQLGLCWNVPAMRLERLPSL